jgi:hypothetical protein
MEDDEVKRLEAELQDAYDKMQATRDPADIQAYREIAQTHIPRLQQIRPTPPTGPGDAAVTAGNVGASAGVQKGA